MHAAHGDVLPPHATTSSDHGAGDQLAAGTIAPAIWIGLVATGLALGGSVAALLPEVRSREARFAITGIATVVVLTLCLRRLRSAAAMSSRLRAARDQFLAIADGTTDALMTIGPGGQVTFANRSLARALGLESTGLLGRAIDTMVVPEDRERFLGMLEEARSRPSRLDRLGMHHARGSAVLFGADGRSMHVDPAPPDILLTLHPLARHDRLEDALDEERERFDRAFDDAPTGMALTDLGGRVFRANAALCSMIDLPEPDLRGVPLPELAHPDDRADAWREIAGICAGGREATRVERKWIRSDGSVVWGVLSASVVRSRSGEPAHVIFQLENTTDRVLLAERLARAAIHDPLTGLPNRVLFMDRLALALERAKRHRQRVAVMFLDVDRFKVINDSLGHAVGDELLVAVADRLRATVRPTDTVARFGGDEFTIVCEDIGDPDEALEIAQRLVDAIAEAISLSSGEVFVSASLGARISLGTQETADTLLRDADAAMYEAKRGPSGPIRLFERSTRVRAVDRHHVGNDLNWALERDQLELHYQPVIHLDTARVHGFEALLRWSHPQRGLLHPGEFIGVAEQTKLIVPIGTWVIEEACRELASWRSLGRSQAGSIRMSVNVSPQQLAEPGFCRTVTEILTRTGVEPSALWLEITESTLVEDERGVIGNLRAIRASGVHFSVDDFGTGYSSLHYLSRFPVEELKVDRSFTNGLGSDRSDTAIVGSVIHLAHALGLTVVAEGVETPVQLTHLRTMGCEFAQGYLLGAPLPAAALGEALLSEIVAPVMEPTAHDRAPRRAHANSE